MNDSRGKIVVVGLGPGKREHLTFRAGEALRQADIILGYKRYTNFVRAFLADDGDAGKEILSSGMRHEVERAVRAVELAEQGKSVAVVSSGDAGIYGMAGLIYEVARERGWMSDGIEVVPGVSALNASASLLGAPLVHDFAAISLSDLLTPWDVIASRLVAAAQADFVIVLYNPKSTKRVEQLAEAQRIICRHRAAATPVGIVRNAYRDGQQVILTDLGHMAEHEVDMLTTIIVGNSGTNTFGDVMVTPRGYETKYELTSTCEE
ncbi:MAG: precorrin-3B C(17)-methyltransferase [Chloroflexi bacterium]|nr:precorrin-3B C(17)-methyltransferase [Chloroflexota bacterium]